jgi:protein TonB
MKQLEAEAKELMTRMKAKAAVAEAQPPAQTRGQAEARDLVEKSLEIARLEAQIRRDFQAYQERPKRRFVGARASEYRFAQYIDNWRQKVERIGNLNYPAEAKARKIYASLQLTVAIKSDGEVESVEINRSSGHKFLDQAAIRIVRLAGPFERFPDNIRADTDILHITRTWSFTRGDQVLAE